MLRCYRSLYARTSDFVPLLTALALLAAVPAVAAPPVLTVPGAQTVDELQPLAFGVSAFDPDGQLTQLRAFNLPTGASFVDHRNDTGSFNWTPASDQSGSYTVTFRADDTFGGFDIETVAVTVNNVNTPPVLGPIADRTMDPGTMAILSFWATDDDQDPLTFTQQNMPSWGQFIDFGDGTAGMLLQPTASTPPGTTTITVSVTDGPNVTSQAFQVTVTGQTTSQPPVVAPFEAPAVAEGASASVTLQASDADGDAMTWSSTLPSFGSLTVLTNTPGSTSARLDLAPGYCASGDHAATVSVSDGTYADGESFTIHVTDTPRTPVWSAPAEGTSVTLLVGANTSVALAASDPDQACGAPPPVLSIAESDAGSALTLAVAATGPGAGTLSVTANAAGTYHVTLRAADAADPERSAHRTVTVVVNAPDPEPEPGPEAAAWVEPRQLRLRTGSDWHRVYLEPLHESFALADVDPTSFRLQAWEGAGNGAVITPLPGGVKLGTDSNLNGVLEYRLTFDKKDLQPMFENLLEPTEGTMTLSYLVAGERVETTFGLKAVPEKKRAIKRCGPNPLNPMASVAIETEQPGRLRVMVFDIQGRMVRRLLDDANSPVGTREVWFDGKDERGRKLHAGRYFIRVETSTGRDVTTLTLLP
jgi:hypothetical protein